MARMTAGNGPTGRWRWDAGSFARCPKMRTTASHYRAATAVWSWSPTCGWTIATSCPPALGLPAGEARQLCDAAILLASLERWGEAALDRLVGDFAFALWDARAQSFMLVRDFLGQRPLHYHRARGFFAFATMPKGLHALSEIPCAPDEQTMLELLAFLPQHGPRTLYREISRVEPGHVVHVTRGGLSSRSFWQPKRSAAHRRKPNDLVEGLRHHLDQATQSCLRGANGAVGAHLSGGFDSAAVTATAARLLAPNGGKVIAFTAVPREGYAGEARRGRICRRRAVGRRHRRHVPECRARPGPRRPDVAAAGFRPQALLI